MRVQPLSPINFGSGEDNSRTLAVPWAVSVLGHVLLILAAFFMPRWAPERNRLPAVINVTMVSLSELAPGGPADTPAPAPPAPVKPAPAPPAPVKPAPAPPAPVKPEIVPPPPVLPAPPAPVPEKAVSMAPAKTEAPVERPPEIKKSLKKETFQPEAKVQQAIEKIEEKVDTGRPSAVSAAIERLKASTAGNTAIERLKRQEAAGGVPGGGKGGGTLGLEPIDVYRLEIAYEVNRNWALSEALTAGGDDLVAEVAFKVLPSGQIQDIWFDRPSGNRYLDESARRAILKSNPLPPHPKGLGRPFVTVGLRFTPKGVQS